MIKLWQKWWRNYSRTIRNGANTLVERVVSGKGILDTYTRFCIVSAVVAKKCEREKKNAMDIIFRSNRRFLYILCLCLNVYANSGVKNLVKSLFLCMTACRLPTIQQEMQQRKLLYMALYLLIWGEAANLRFMPECLCYIYHHVCFSL